jgi:hypothetical protein
MQPFLRNSNVILALFFGCFISGVVTVDGKKFWNENIIENAPGAPGGWAVGGCGVMWVGS